MAFGLANFKTTAVGIATLQALNAKRAEVCAAARAGEPPLRIISPLIKEHLGNNRTNAMVGRMIREWLGPCFQVRGRMFWPRENGTESGSYYAYSG